MEQLELPFPPIETRRPLYDALPRPDATSYCMEEPFPHAVFQLPGFQTCAWEANAHLGQVLQEAYSYSSPLELKRAEDRIDRIPTACAGALREMGHPKFLQWLEELTRISGLVPDPYLRGGGLHMIPPGGKLDVHLDYNVHPILKLYRRVNVLLYLNPNWRDEDGGHLELWSGHTVPNWTAGCMQHVLTRCERRVLPQLGCMAIFSTSECSYHGHPDPTGNRWRLSLSTYYYTAEPGPECSAEPHSTVFLRRPQDPPDAELDDLRVRRARGRTASNVQVEGRKD